MARKLIVITGYCATGKSTFGRKLAEVLGIPCFSKDTLKEAMANGFGVNSEELQSMGSIATARLMMEIATCCLHVGQACILEANFKQNEGEWIKSLITKYEAECLTYLFIGDLHVLWDRYVKREVSRHWVHKTIGEDKRFFVEGHLKAGLGDVRIGQTIKIDATDFTNVNYEVLMKQAKYFLSEV